MSSGLPDWLLTAFSLPFIPFLIWLWHQAVQRGDKALEEAKKRGDDAEQRERDRAERAEAREREVIIASTDRLSGGLEKMAQVSAVLQAVLERQKRAP